MSNPIGGRRAQAQVSPEMMTEILASAQTLLQLARPNLDSLSAEESRRLPRGGDKGEVFSAKAYGYANEQPEFRPPFVKLEDLASLLDRAEKLRQLQRTTDLLKGMVDDSVSLANSDAYSIALAIYAQVKTAARHNLPGAQTILDDLSRYFQARVRGASSDEPASEEETESAQD